MAKIRKELFRVFGKNEEFTIHYTAKRAQFRADLPECLVRFLEISDRDEPTGKSEEELVKNIKDLISFYEKAAVKERIVIAYKARWGSKNIVENYSNWGRLEKDEEGRCCDEAKISFEYEVLLERDVDGKKKWYQRERGEYDEDKHIWVENKENVFKDHETNQWDAESDMIEWTPEREKFMEDLYAALELLINKLKGFTAKPELLLAVVDRGFRQLENKSNEPDKS